MNLLLWVIHTLLYNSQKNVFFSIKLFGSKSNKLNFAEE